MHPYALYMNGIYQEVLDHIILAQSKVPGLQLYLQPYSGSAIAKLRDSPPDISNPVRLYASITEDLQRVHYTGNIIRWEDKTNIGPFRKNLIERRLAQYQPTEHGLYNAAGDGEGTSINLLTVLNVAKLQHPFDVQLLIKIDDEEPLSPNRNRAGGWSYVMPEPEF